ncbi:MAG: AAA family ATPase, partial [Polyangiaceae bacterium]|nr:AAA family ATPase [Polyangiaceae bacterium]
MAHSTEIALGQLITQAEAVAHHRSETLSGIHLFAALGGVPGGVRDLLNQSGANFRRVLDNWERLGAPGGGGSLEILYRRVSEVARQFGAKSPLAPHLLLTLLEESGGPINTTLQAMNVDVEELRQGAIRLGQGQPTRTALKRNRPRPAARAQVVPVMPREPVAGPKYRVPTTSRKSPTTAQSVPVVPQVGAAPFRGRRQTSPPEEVNSEENQSALSEESVATKTVATNPAAQTFGRDEQAELASQTAAASVAELSRRRFELPKKKFPILTQVGRNLSLAAAENRLDPVVGRNEEIESALDVLAKRHANNPCLIGPSGVGKTSVARGIALHLASVAAEDSSEDRIVIELPISELLAGTGVRGALAGRLNALKKEVRLAEGRVILFFDEIHQLFAGDAAEEIAADMKLSLARGELPCIGATSSDEYRRVIEGDSSLARRFSAVEIEEPSREDAYVVLSSVAARLEEHHGVRFSEEALSSAISWSLRYLPGRCLPDKAVSLIDLAGARSRRRRIEEVNRAAVAEVVASQASMPLDRLLESDGDRMMQLEESLKGRVIGHEEHLAKIARILRRNAAGIGMRRPIGTFLLLGPTGVGKTETAKAIADVLFHNEGAMTRIDMAEMSESHAVAKLVGAPPGYIGHDAGGQLTEAVRRRPYQVILLDEIEKAHPDVLTTFLAVFDEGRMTDSRGRLVDFTNTVMILTS